MAELKRWAMKRSAIPFAIAGLFTALLFAFPVFEELAFVYAIFFGPSIVFAIAVLVLTRDEDYPRARRVFVFLVSLLTYYIGIVVQGRFGASALGHWHVYFAPVIAAGLCLSGIRLCGRVPLGSGQAWLLALKGTLCSILSVLPLFLSTVAPGWSYLCWGVHIWLWYVAVGPHAIAILKQKEAQPTVTANAGKPAWLS